MAKTVHTDKAPVAIGPHVQGKAVGNSLSASGQVPLPPKTGEAIGITIQEQTKQVLKNISAIPAEAGTDFDHVVKATCFLSDMNDSVPFNDVYAMALEADSSACSAVEVARLSKGVKVEVEVIAYLDQLYLGLKPETAATSFCPR